MKNYRITVNGNVYDVTVEETSSGAATTSSKTATIPSKVVPVQRQVSEKPVVEKMPTTAPIATGASGNITVNASVPGKVVKVEVKPGQSVKAGENLLILEAMKMEIPVVSPQAGTIATVEVAEGASVESGAILVTLN